MPITATRACRCSILVFSSEKCVVDMAWLLIIELELPILARRKFRLSGIRHPSGSQIGARQGSRFCAERVTSVTVQSEDFELAEESQGCPHHPYCIGSASVLDLWLVSDCESARSRRCDLFFVMRRRPP